MPRIDPLQLLRCLGVLLTKDGGIKTKDEVQRLASLMMKFSKKLVSKCVYILILKNTETELLGMFMSAGGWTLILTWLSDGIFGKNWALVTELLQLLLMCPVDVERLKSNSIPRLVKGLSKDENLGQVNVLATKLVEQWLKIVKDETVAPPERESKATVVIVKQQKDYVVEMTKAEDGTPEHMDEMTLNVVESSDASVTPSASAAQQVISPQQFYKLTVRDGKQVIAKVDSVSASDVMTEIQDEIKQPELKEERTLSVESSDDAKVKKDTEKRSSNKDRTKHDRSKHKSSSSSRSGSSSSNKDKSSSNSSSSSSRDKHKDKSRDKSRDKDKYKHKSNGSIKHSSSKDSSNKDSSSHNKERQAEKDKDTLAKIQPKSVEKLGRIPKKSSSSDEKEKKDKKTPEHRAKPSISIEVRKKDGGERPKTVKVFNSKLRSTGLEEAPRLPPPRPTAKKSVTLPAVLPVKRASPLRESIPPPEKRMKLPETSPVEEKPGGIKLIPAKPKPTFLQESDMFMDALAASATNKKEPKKRKRRASISKDSSNTNHSSPPTSPTNSTSSPLNSPLALKSITPPKFYKDTLETDEPKSMDAEEEKQEVEEASKDNSPAEPEEEGPTENVVKEVNGIRGVLVYHKRKGPKKCVKWKVETELEEIQYFELDETERINVTKTFMDMKQMEHTGEREAMILSRKLPNEDLMDEKTTWRALILQDLKPALAEPGKKSLEKDIQFAREKVVLQAIYFKRSLIPDSASEPDPENHQMTDPVIIPLDDVTGNPDSVNDYHKIPWPEPKGSPPHINPQVPGGPPVFPGMPGFNNPMGGPPGFPGMPQNFGGPNFVPPPNMMGGDWRGMPDGPNMPPDVNHGPMNPVFNNRPDGFNMMDENVGFPPQGFGPGPMPGPMQGGPMQGGPMQGGPMQGGPMQGPMQGGPMQGGPMQGGPMQGGPMQGGPMQGGPMQGGPMQGGPMPGGPMQGGPMQGGPMPGGPMPGPMQGPSGPGQMYGNFPQNNRGNNRTGFRNNMGRGGWFRPSGPPQNWRGGANSGNHWGGRGGGVCKQFKMHGYCRQRDTCPFMHPQNNTTY